MCVVFCMRTLELKRYYACMKAEMKALYHYLGLSHAGNSP